MFPQCVQIGVNDWRIVRHIDRRNFNSSLPQRHDLTHIRFFDGHQEFVQQKFKGAENIVYPSQFIRRPVIIGRPRTLQPRELVISPTRCLQSLPGRSPPNCSGRVPDELRNYQRFILQQARQVSHGHQAVERGLGQARGGPG